MKTERCSRKPHKNVIFFSVLRVLFVQIVEGIKHSLRYPGGQHRQMEAGTAFVIVSSCLRGLDIGPGNKRKSSCFASLRHTHHFPKGSIGCQAHRNGAHDSADLKHLWALSSSISRLATKHIPSPLAIRLREHQSNLSQAPTPKNGRVLLQLIPRPRLRSSWLVSLCRSGS